MTEYMSESKRVELDNPEAEKMYGPALMGLPTRNGHLVALIPVPGMVLMGGGREITITAVEYGYDRNIIRCTCESQGEVAVMGWEQIYEGIEAGKLEVVK